MPQEEPQSLGVLDWFNSQIQILAVKLRPFFIAVALIAAAPATLLANGQLEIRVIDKDTGQATAVRMHLKNAQGKVIKPPGVPALGDHFVFFDKVVLKLANGGYEFLVERGDEY